MGRITAEEILLLFWWGMDTITKPTLHNLLAGYEEFAHRKDVRWLIERIHEKELVERSGTGKHVSFRLTGKGLSRLNITHPQPAWERPWDGTWRVITFDLPEARRNDRMNLWRAFRTRKLGMLQQSVWLWPHPLQPILAEIIQVEGVPECFCGFEARELFLCTSAEIVATAWPWEKIHRQHTIYLNRLTATPQCMATATDLGRLGHFARLEWRAYQDAFAFDPLLPERLWPKDYAGRAVERLHQNCLTRWRHRFAQLAANKTM